MKISNLFLFFGYFEGPQSIPVAPAEVEGARGWRHHAHAAISGARVNARVHRSRVEATASVDVPGVRSTGHAGSLSGVADSVSQPTHSSTRTQVGQIRALGQAKASVLTFERVTSRMQAVAGSASVSTLARGVHSTSRIGQVHTHIGPDEVEQEFEEILLLLEVA